MTDVTDPAIAIVDLHSHLVPGVDDGTRTVAESIQALSGLYREGVRAVVTTPHLLVPYLDSDAAIQRELDLHRRAFDGLVASCRDRTDLPSFWLGQEILAPDAGSANRVARRADVGLPGRFLLVEFGFELQGNHNDVIRSVLDAGRQVVIAADRPPSDLESLDDRVRSRLAGGLVVEMGSLGEELRLGILKSRVAAARAHHATFDVPAPVLDYLARTITHNGRDLEGAINRLLAHSKLNAQPVTLEMAEREVRDLIRPQEPKRIKIEDIQRVVARQYNVSRSDLLSSRRTANVASAARRYGTTDA